jgi:F-type H+-transporting ATPase subunit epsilon
MMIDKLFHLTVIQPDKVIYDGKAVSLIAPCESGYLGVMADHAALAANIVSGSITIKPQVGQPTVVVACRGKGFLEVLNNNVSLVLNYTDADQ